jgi:hypothetical protein
MKGGMEVNHIRAIIYVVAVSIGVSTCQDPPFLI